MQEDKATHWTECMACRRVGPVGVRGLPGLRGGAPPGQLWGPHEVTATSQSPSSLQDPLDRGKIHSLLTCQGWKRKSNIGLKMWKVGGGIFQMLQERCELKSFTEFQRIPGFKQKRHGLAVKYIYIFL